MAPVLSGTKSGLGGLEVRRITGLGKSRNGDVCFPSFPPGGSLSKHKATGERNTEFRTTMTAANLAP